MTKWWGFHYTRLSLAVSLFVPLSFRSHYEREANVFIELRGAPALGFTWLPAWCELCLCLGFIEIGVNWSV